jgi:hypothetical protein
MLAGIETGELDPVKLIATHELIHEHVAKHVEYISGDPSSQAEAAQYRELVANSEAVLMNSYRAAQKIERESAGASELQEGQVDPKLRAQELKLQEISQRIELQKITMAAKENREQQRFEQEMALKDVAMRNNLAKSA